MNNPLIYPGIGVIFWMLVSFGILVFILGKWGWPMMLKALNNREKAIKDSLEAAEREREAMKNLKCENEELLKKAKIERDEILKNARLTGEQIVEDAKAKAEEEILRMREAAVESINNEKLRAMHDLKNQIATLSIDIAEKLVKAELASKEMSQTLINKELDEVKF
ncbi:MAG: F0F1 ATP synthase subunit B [Bacteroidales bacterium]|jgi:F-type H+-transporting ATPase subunit b|nr:F0F1 ATP synthase subunit B [Bacteroidales bacterium]